ncbi:MAG: hypothetical protein LBV41_03685 [Cytophagaceae bacterium]|nr:hypothetical protein [Cytophagaceae bacterium]
MKKLLFIVAVAAVAGLSACNKEKECTCTTSAPGISDTVTTVTIKDGKCADGNSEVTTAGYTVKTTCK